MILPECFATKLSPKMLGAVGAVGGTVELTDFVALGRDCHERS